MSTPPPLPDSSRWWKLWIAAVVGVPMFMIFGVWAGEKLKVDALVFVGLGLGVMIWTVHIYFSVMLAKAIAAGRVALGRKASMEGLVIGLLFGGWAVMFAIFFCGCLAVLMSS